MTQPVSHSPGTSRHNLAQLVLEVLHEIQRRGVSDSLAIMNRSGLTLPQIITLHTLRMKGDRTVSEIAAQTNLSAAATSHLVERLYQRGLVDRVEDENDRRQKRVSVSDKGILLVDRLTRSRKEGMAKALECLAPNTRNQLAEVLGQVVKELMSAEIGFELTALGDSKGGER